MLLTIVNVVASFFGEKMSGTSAFVNAVFWIIAVKVDLDVKLLKAIDMICAANKLSANDTKAAPNKTPNQELLTKAGI